MSNNSISVADAAQNLSEKTGAIATEAQGWIANNGLNILIASAVGVVIALALLGIRALGCRMVGRVTPGTDPRWPILFARVIAKTSLFFIILVSAQLVAEHAETPPAILQAINFLFVIAATLQAAIWARELILGYIQHRAGADDGHGTLSSAMGIVRLLVTVALFAVAIVVILDNLGVNVTGLIAGLGIGGIAIGLAAQGIFSDLFAALSIIFDRPFRRGDMITFGTFTGRVEKIGLKSTRIRALNGELVVVSNTNLLNMQLQNFAPLQQRRALMTFGTTYQIAPDLIPQLGEELKAIVEKQPNATFDRCHAFQFGASSIDFELVFHVEGTEFTAFADVRQAVMVEMMRRFAELGVEFAYPTQVTFTAAPDGRMVMPYPHVKMLAEGECGNEGQDEVPRARASGNGHG
ncbi:mechanosensitive ion channel family protein [Sphingosinicella sp. BN140058]|uniref:mechanosensitive ion channel family protein n=1 Tax=Sphingosinicella sp. BN140058 TaxID=1892855 RepID=UPI001011A8A6|nr:mechanosensitive ion channel domain-containing protein [Sphingosinicella sp. BN140058]QAY76531.1 mechanosensitive ion channel [Sphingosinicella sp. BN140058]